MADPKIRIRATDDTGPAFRSANANMAAMEAAASKTAGALKGIGAGIVAFIGVRELASMTKSILDAADALNDLKDATGSSIENLSALEDLALRTGTSFEDVGATLVKFNQALTNAKPNSATQAAFDALGLSIGELRNLDPSEALRRTSVALSRFADDGNKARLVQQLFGESVRATAPFLKDLADAGGLVAKVTTAQAAEAEKFNRQLLDLNANLRDVARTAAGPLVEGFNRAYEAIKKAAQERTGWFASMADLAAQAKAASDRNYTGSWSDAGGGRGFINPPLVLPSLPGTTDAGDKKPKPPRDTVADELARYVEGLQAAIDRTQDLSAVEEARLFLSRKGAGAAAQADAGRILSLARQIDETRALIDLDKALDDKARTLNLARQADETRRLNDETRALIDLDETLADQARNQIQRRQDNIDRLLGATPSAQLEKSRADMVLLTEEFQRFIDTAGQAGINEQTYLEAVSARLNLTGKDLEETRTLADDLGLTFQSAFEDAIVGGKSFSDVLKGIERDIVRIAVRRAITEPLDKFVSGAIGNLFSFDGGGYTGAGARSGGVDGKGGFLSVLHPQETVIDHSKGQGAGVVAVHLNTQVGDVASMRYVEAAVQRGMQRALGAVSRQERYT